jgi:hypothetical protein
MRSKPECVTTTASQLPVAMRLKSFRRFVAGFGLLDRDVEPILLLHSITASLVVTCLIGLVVEFIVGVVKSFTQQNTARRTADNGVGIAF